MHAARNEVRMRDEDIISLYLARDESAVEKTAEAYGRYLEAVAYNVLGNRESSRECVNEAYYRLWGSIPPHEPKSLLTYACKIVRRLAIDAYRKDPRRAEGRKRRSYLRRGRQLRSDNAKLRIRRA